MMHNHLLDNQANQEDLHIVRLMAQGHNDEYIAKILAISVRTTRRRIANIITKLGARNRFSAGVAAALNGWLDYEKDINQRDS